MSPAERITALEADVAKLQWQVAQLIDHLRKQEAAKLSLAVYDECMKEVYRKCKLAEPYSDEPAN